MPLKISSNDRIWIVGASAGIGSELAKTLSNKGASLILSARNELTLKKLNTELGGTHQVAPLDIADLEQVKRVSENIMSDDRPLTRVIVMAAAYKPMAMDHMDMHQVHRIVQVNLNGTFNILHTIVPYFRQCNKGQIALCASVAGYIGLPNGQPYSSTKAAVINLAESLRLETPKEIDIKLINPGFVRTRMTAQNTFAMPSIIEASDAADAIAKGLEKSSFEIHFPKRFTYMLKLVSSLPYWLCLPLLQRQLKK